MSFGSALQRALSRRGGAPALDPPGARPPGELIWGHATSDERLAALRDLGQRLAAQRPGVQMLITLPEGGDAAQAACGGFQVQPLGPDHPVWAAQFLDHWRPDLCFWTGGRFHHTLLRQADRRGVPLFLIDASLRGLETTSGRRIPGLMRDTVSRFRRAMANSSEAYERLLRLGLRSDAVSVTTRLRNSGTAPPCDEDHLRDATEILGQRPIWLAAHVRLPELPVILAAHRDAARLAHRLLLVIAPAEVDDADAVLSEARAAQLRCTDWTAGEIPDEATQVLITQGGPELGLWLRAAPLTFLGSSLEPGHGGCDPFAAAALGSAVLYGPNVRDHLAAYSRLAAAGAARIVKDTESLGAAVTRLIAPDQAASMALAGWEVVSEGAHLTDALMEMAQDTLDHRGGAAA